MSDELVIDGNPGARKIGDGEWEGHTSTLQLERFIFHPESATEAQLTLSVTGFSGEEIATYTELTYRDLVGLRAKINEIMVEVVRDGRAGRDTASLVSK